MGQKIIQGLMQMVIIRDMSQIRTGNFGVFGLQCWVECLCNRLEVADIGIMCAKIDSGRWVRGIQFNAADEILGS